MKKKILFVSTRLDSPVHSDRVEVLSVLKGYLDGIDAEVDSVLLEDLVYEVVNGSPRIVTTGGTDMAEYDLAYLKNWRAAETSGTALAIYLEANGCKVLCSELKYFRATDKIAEAFLFSSNSVPYPDTLFALRGDRLIAAIEQHADFNYPLVVKAINGSAGDHNHLVRSTDELKKIVKADPELQFMAQTVIENDGDHRVLMMGFAPRLSFKRMRTDDSTHLNNTSQGATAELTPLETYSAEVLADCEKVCRLVNREIAGVDVLFDRNTGRHVILEVNASPQLSTGAFLAEKRVIVREFFQEELEKL